ncbi:DUF6132 family protein [bacterium]|nr:DUF6132 family protein [bacterium]
MIVRVVTGILIGGLAGFAIGYFGKCSTGACPITSNPYISTAVGAAIGFLAAWTK